MENECIKASSVQSLVACLPLPPCLPSPLTFLADAQAALQLRQGDGPILVQVAIVGEPAGTLLGLGSLLQVSLERLEFPVVNVLAAVVVQLGKVPVDHPLL